MGGSCGMSADAYPVQDEVSVAKLESAECHGHPALDVGRQEHQRTVFYHELEIGIQEFQYEIQVFLR